MPDDTRQSQLCRIGRRVVRISFFDYLIVVTVLASILVNLVALIGGVTIVAPHLFYVPIILVSYRYPKSGVPFAVAVSALYLGMHAALVPGFDALAAAAIRVSIFLGIAVTVSFLSWTLNREKRRYRSIFDTSGAGIFLIRRDTFTILQANRHFEDQLGFAPGEVEGMEIGRIWQDAPAAREHLSAVQEGEPVADLKAAFTGKNGDVRCVLLSAAVMDDDLIVCTTIDITDQRRAEAKVQEREATLQALFEGAGIGMARYDLDSRIVECNPMLQEVLGYTREELIGLHFGEATHPDDTEPEMVLYRDLVGGRLDRYQVDKRNIRKDGGAIWVRKTVSLVRDAAGAPQFAIGMVEDVTERTRAEWALRESEDRYRTLFENVADAVFIHDLGGRFLEVNDAAINRLGCSRDELLGMSIQDIDSPEYASEVPARIRELKENGHAIFESAHVRADGSVFPIELSSRIIHFQGMPAVLSVARDISVRKAAEEKIRIQRDFGLHLAAVSSRDDAMALCLKTAIQVLGVDSGMIYRKDEGTGMYLLVTNVNLSEEYLQMVSDLPGECECAQRFENRTPIYGTSLDVSPSMLDVTLREGIRSFALLPILSRNDVVGGCFIASHTLDEVPQSVRDDLETMVAQMGNALHRILAEEDLRKSEERFRLLAENARDLIYRIDFVPERRFTYVSPAATAVTGYSPEEHYADPDLGWKMVHTDDRHLLTALADGRLSWDEPLALRWVKKDGSVIWTEQQNVPIYDDAGRLVALEGIARDISELKRYSEQLERSLREKEILLKEVHHRVKNNMQVISSLMSLQAYATGDDEIVDALRESEMRVKSMALVHETLYQSADFARIYAAEYVRMLVGELVASYTLSADIDLQVDVEDLSLELDAAIPCGLIINELVSNALKHAFRGRKKGTLEVGMHRIVDGRIVLSVRDDGVGLPEDLDPLAPRSESLGLELVTILSRQLGGTLTCERKAGTSFEIAFPEWYQQGRRKKE
ncbi:PAS domain S-box protein [Methanoculleus sp. FWC-SCC1]|uniref:PAS domain S-box protein n=1 Tax=Methanoculleus frigidifontis TaxID=2584085 RepID=A0ABT8M7L4_9EURY|nr:PAS domain S-box protein [Methanoculleus sp. FWC-SCC1]MDN7023884.1 PAS domain S-box protein [Methanoculleus sp. FWC-SCC1]